MTDEVLIQPLEVTKSLDLMQDKLDDAKIDFEKNIAMSLQNLPSNLDGYDLAFCFIAGIAGTTINKNESIQKFLQSVHEDASIDNPKTLLGKLLKHKGDHMDIPPGMSEFKDRAGQNPMNPHRIMWGHDILSFGKDNPFYLLINQYGVGRGIFQALRHLIADTCSKQGLPIPTSSWWDYSRGDGKPLGNQLVDFCKNINDEVGRSNKGTTFNNSTFNQLFSIQMQDVMAKGLTFGLVKAYVLARGIKNEIRIPQIHLLSTFVHFFSLFIWDAFRTSMPTINWIVFLSMVKLTAQLHIKSDRESKELQRITMEIVEATIGLEKRVYLASELFITHTDPWSYVNDYRKEQQNLKGLINFFEEE